MITDITSVGYKMHKKINILFNIKVLHMEHNITNKFITTSVNIPCS